MDFSTHWQLKKYWTNTDCDLSLLLARREYSASLLMLLYFITPPYGAKGIFSPSTRRDLRLHSTEKKVERGRGHYSFTRRSRKGGSRQRPLFWRDQIAFWRKSYVIGANPPVLKEFDQDLWNNSGLKLFFSAIEGKYCQDGFQTFSTF